ncbi:MAG: hypothetical protein HZA54_10235, partial [Planctomycetes bacterium]|nr:hypothetical protein [Planctomycetota bacterium]
APARAQRGTPPDAAAARAALVALRALPEGYFPCEVRRILHTLRPASEADSLREELVAIELADKPRLSALGLFLSAPGAVANLAGPDAAAATGAPPADPAPGDLTALRTQVRALQRDINLLNLMNGMNFTAEQLRAIAAEVRAAVTPPPPAVASAPAAEEPAAAAYTATLRSALALLEAGKPVPAELMARARREPAQGVAAPGGKSLRRPGGGDAPGATPPTDEQVARVAALLTEEQRSVLLDYKHCLIPPKDLKNPVRVGQANDAPKGAELLDKSRTIPAGMYAARRPEVLERALSRVEEHLGRFPEEERAEALRKLGEVIDRARALSEVEYRMQREPLAQELTFLDRKERIKDRLVELGGGATAEIERKVRRTLFDSALVALAEERVRQLEHPAAAPATDLDAIDPAPACHDGKCALPEEPAPAASPRRKP